MNDGNGAGRQGESLKTLKPKCNTMKQKIVVFEMTGCGQNRNITHLTIKTEQHTTNSKRNKAVICWKDRNFVELAIIATTSHTSVWRKAQELAEYCNFVEYRIILLTFLHDRMWKIIVRLFPCVFSISFFYCSVSYSILL